MMGNGKFRGLTGCEITLQAVGLKATEVKDSLRIKHVGELQVEVGPSLFIW
jgi:hypothetical protein